MYFLRILCMLFVFTVGGFELLNINTAYRRFKKQMKLTAELRSMPVYCVHTKWIKQKLDHFDINETRTWKMKYYQRLDFWRRNGPIYLYINGEVPAEIDDLVTGIMVQLANETSGAMFSSEHRYYGESQPVKRTNIDDMKYLSARQALADNAHLLKSITKDIRFRSSKVIVIGGSYAGNLAAWMKLVYPDLVNAAIASSSPVLAKRDFYEYFEVVNENYKKYGTPGCLESIQNIFQRYETLFKTDEGIKQLKEEENVCEDFDIAEPLNKQLFFYNKLNNFTKNADLSYFVKEHCSKLNATPTENDKSNCYNDSFENMIQKYRENENDFAWTYQTCTEFGYFQSTTSDKQPFTKNLPVEFFDKMCTALFGEGFGKDKVNDGVRKTNEMYGGLSPNVTNVVFVNGELDPWSALGIVEDISYDVPAIYIPKSSHCTDLLSDEEDDPVELTEARLRIKALIKQWIGMDNNTIYMKIKLAHVV